MGLGIWPLAFGTQAPEFISRVAEWLSGLEAANAPVPGQVFGLGAGGLRRNGQWLAFVGLEVLGYGRVSEMLAERRGAHEP